MYTVLCTMYAQLALETSLQLSQAGIWSHPALFCAEDSHARGDAARVERCIGARPPVAGGLSRQSALPSLRLQKELPRLHGPFTLLLCMFVRVSECWRVGPPFLQAKRKNKKLSYGPVHCRSVDMGHFSTCLSVGIAMVDDRLGEFPPFEIFHVFFTGFVTAQCTWKTFSRAPRQCCAMSTTWATSFGT